MFLGDHLDTSIGRNFGSPLALAVAAMASVVILLSSGPTAMNASRAASRVNSAIWLVANWWIVDFRDWTPDSSQDHAQQGDIGLVRPTIADAMPGEIVILRCSSRFLEPPGESPKVPEKTTVLKRMAISPGIAVGVIGRTQAQCHLAARGS